MIFSSPVDTEPLDQGDIFEECPVPWTVFWDLDREPKIIVETISVRVIVLTQTCDLANNKASFGTLAAIRNADDLVEKGILKAADIRGPIRSGKTWGYYYLPKSEAHGLPEMIVDLRQLHTVRLDMLRALVQRGKRRARLQPLYREHLNRFFAETYARIGLPAPYATD